MEEKLVQLEAPPERSEKSAEPSPGRIEQFYHEIVAGSPDPIQVLSLEGALLWTNEAGRATFRVDGAGPRGRPRWIDFWEGEDRPAAGGALAASARGAAKNFIGRLPAARDGTKWEVRITPLLDAAGKPEYLLVVSRALIVRPQDDEARSRLAAVVESSDDAILSMTLEAIVTTWNRGAELMFGYEAGEIIGRSVTILIPEGREDEEPEILERLKRGERIQHYETVRRRKDGAEVDVSLSVSPIFDSQGRMVGASKISRDISERKRAEAELGRHAAELERQIAERTVHLRQTIQSLEGVCYTIAHDLRAPLRALQGFTTIILDEYGAAFDARGRNFAARIAGGAAKMDALIHELLDYAKLSHIELPCVDLDLNTLVENVLRNLASEIEARRAGFHVAGGLGKISANRTLLEQILTNLFANALKFVQAGVAPEVNVTSEQRGGYVRLAVRDNGIGIAREHHARIFEMFQRLHNDEKTYPGTGVGLAIVKKGMERLGGRVTVDSSPGSGTCFYLDLRASA